MPASAVCSLRGHTGPHAETGFTLGLCRCHLEILSFGVKGPIDYFHFVLGPANPAAIPAYGGGAVKGGLSQIVKSSVKL